MWPVCYNRPNLVCITAELRSKQHVYFWFLIPYLCNFNFFLLAFKLYAHQHLALYLSIYVGIYLSILPAYPRVEYSHFNNIDIPLFFFFFFFFSFFSLRKQQQQQLREDSRHLNPAVVFPYVQEIVVRQRTASRASATPCWCSVGVSGCIHVLICAYYAPFIYIAAPPSYKGRRTSVESFRYQTIGSVTIPPTSPVLIGL
ncbi:hypothetical protein F4815DRAFT_327385 [Daldinia loculata]|nr:hypothetical protein F4815DRAFT_327385 [Daldinia loculata]